MMRKPLPSVLTSRRSLQIAGGAAALALVTLLTGALRGTPRPASLSSDDAQSSLQGVSTAPPVDLARRAMTPLAPARRLRGSEWLPEIYEFLRPKEDDSISALFHAAHLFGKDAVFRLSDGQLRTLLELMRHSASQVGPDQGRRTMQSQGLLVRTRHGLRFPQSFGWALSSNSSVAEAHPGQGLATLAGLGIPLSTPVSAGDGEVLTVQNILDDILANYTPEGEIYWDALAIAIYLPPGRAWKDKFGEEHTLDDLVVTLMGRSPEESSCGGTHVLIALTALFRVDREFPVLSAKTRAALQRYLRDTVVTLKRTLLPEGGWTLDWNLVEQNEKTRRATDERILIATGHHLEWLLLLPNDYDVPPEMFDLSAERCLRILRERASDKQWVEDHYCPAIHAARSAGILGGMRPTSVGSPAPAKTAGE